jgi:hypothetical protein
MNDQHYHRQKSQISNEEITFGAKLEKLIDHWIKHNNDHVKTYEQWAQRASENHFLDVADHLKRAAARTLEISDDFLEAKKRIKKEAV